MLTIRHPIASPQRHGSEETSRESFLPQQLLVSVLVGSKENLQRMAESEKRKKGWQGSVVSDPRFAKLHTDARFQKFPNKERKVEIDDRFKGEPVLGSWQAACHLLYGASRCIRSHADI